MTPKPVSTRRKRRRYDRFQMPQEHAMNIIEEGTEQQADSSSDDEGPVNDATDLNEEIDFDDDELFEAPDTYNSDQEDPIITDTDINDSWILL